MAKFKYCIDGSELVIKDLPAVPATYNDGEILKAGVVEAGGIASQGVGTGDFVGVSNQGETLPAQSGLSSAGITFGNDGATLTGTQAAGTLDTLKVIINPGAIYALQYDTDTAITWSAVTDTTIVYTCTSGVGAADFGGGWAYSTDTGEFDYVVSSAVSGTDLTLTTVTDTNQTSGEGILISQAGTGLSQVVPLTADSLGIAQVLLGDIDGLTAGGDSLALTILENRVESVFQGSEILRPKKTPGSGGIENQAVRTLGGKDNTKIFAYAKIEGNVWNR
jgi:hypothetical protein